MHDTTSRRGFFQRSMLGAAAFTTPGLFADELTPTQRAGAGPFYPDKLPLDTDNDLLRINDATTPAVGEVTYLSGRVLTKTGAPLRNAVVEIWQVDNRGSYIHSDGGRPEGRDPEFQGYGRFLTGLKGEYAFRTIKPVPYGTRTPHVHFAISLGDQRVLETQMCVQGHPLNEQDFLFRQVRDPKLRATILADFRPVAGSRIGELQVEYDLVLDHTVPAEDVEPPAPERRRL